MDIRPKQNVPLSSHTVFKIGGVARYFYESASRESTIAAVQWARQYKLPFLMLGAGSNMLVSEKGFSGLVIKPVHGDIHVLGNTVTADAGVMMPRLSAESAREGLAGFEWASGIPGTVGGSVRGNAGCFGACMADVIESVRVFDAILGREKKFSSAECRFEYRESIFKKHPEYVIMSATIALTPAATKDIQETMKTYSLHRVKTQAIGSQCAGCVFKNVPWERYSFSERQKILTRIPELQEFKNQSYIPTAFVLDHLGLKGYAIGKAAVSKKHANFIVNTGGASAHEVQMLISHCKEYVHRKTGMLLEEEIHYIA